jgi:hypothetical protein
VRHKRRRSGPRWTGGRIARVGVAAVAALLLAWLAVRSSVVNGLARANPFVADRIAHGDPRVAIELAMVEFALRNGRVGPASRARAERALDRAELADEPFLLAAVDAAAHGDAARSETLLTEARRRNPRDRLTRLLLLDRYLRTGRSAQAGTELAVLTQLIPQVEAALVPQLLQLARDPKTRPGLALILKRNPSVRDLLLGTLAGNPADSGLVMELAAASGAGANPAAPPAWQSTLLNSLVGHGDFARAYALWRGFLRQPAEDGPKGLYDGAFRGAPGAAPFNWSFASGSDGTVDRTPAPALQVQYYGRGAVNLASQLLMLRPGSYKLQLRAEGDAKGEGSILSWTLSCAGSKAPIVRLPLKGIASAPRLLAAGFAIPAGCPAQWLRLEGSPGDVASEQDVTLSNLQLTGPAGS